MTDIKKLFCVILHTYLLRCMWSRKSFLMIHRMRYCAIHQTYKQKSCKFFKLKTTTFVDIDDIAWWLGTTRAQASIKLLI